MHGGALSIEAAALNRSSAHSGWWRRHRRIRGGGVGTCTLALYLSPCLLLPFPPSLSLSLSLSRSFPLAFAPIRYFFFGPLISLFLSVSTFPHNSCFLPV